MTLRTSGNKGLAGFLERYLIGAALFIACVGAHAQGVSVSNAGTPSYTMPIAVPPGIGGMTPNIGLLYSASGINGPVGHGWSVQGISLITRCAGNKRIDGVARSVEYGGNDKLCLDGQRLIQTDASGNPTANQQGDSLGGAGMVREYRTDKDIYARIRAYGASGDPLNGPSYFKVWTKSGQIYEYGDMAGKAAINVTNKGIITAWAVSRISDTPGNYMDFRYEQRDVAWGSGPAVGNATPGHEWRLKEILYTGTATQQPVNRVVFEYTERPDMVRGTMQDRSEAYHQGGKNVSIWLLDKVSTYINWPGNVPSRPANAVHVKSIKLDYDNGPMTVRSRLVKVRECADINLSKCLPATTFNYSPGGGLNYTPINAFKYGELSTTVMTSTKGDYGVLTGNFFGNGRTSILRWSDAPGENRMFRSDGDGAFTAIPNGTGAGQFNITNQNLFKSDGCYTSTAVDFNGDGLTDILRTQGEGLGCYAPSILYLSNGDGSFRVVNVTGVDLHKERAVQEEHFVCDTRLDMQDLCPGGLSYEGTSRSNGWNYYLLDVNNDGILDVVTALSPGFGKTANYPTSDITQCANEVCTRVFLGQRDNTFIEMPSTNLVHVPMYTEPYPGYYTPRDTYIADVNGDGLADLVVSSGTWLSRGNGNFDYDPTLQAGIGCEFAMDFNGDGRSDCLIPHKNVAEQKLLVSDGTYRQIFAGNFNLNGAGLALLADGAYWPLQAAGVQIGDFNGDGRADILHWKDDPSQNRVYQSNGDGTFSAGAFNLTTTNDQLQKSDGSARFVLGDFSGRGAIEILRLKAAPSSANDASRNQLYAKTDPMPPDQLMSVRTGNGITTSLNWVPLTNPDTGSLGPRYKSDRGTPDAAVYPMVDVLTPTYVVATVTTNAGFGGTLQKIEYAYSGMKMAYDGRGWLGFRSNAIQNTAPNDEYLTVTAQNIQHGPNPGPASMSETRRGVLDQPSAPLLSRSTFIYCDKTATAGAQESATPGTPCATSAKVQRPYLYKSTEEGWDLEGVGLPTVTTTNTFNNSGDAREILTVTSSTSGAAQSSSKRTTNDYQPENTSGDSWILGRLKTATVLNDVSGSSSLLPTVSAGAPTSGSGTDPGVTPIQPAVNPAALMAIINLLLGDD
ncbi:Repeat domain-containing protein [Janthinobacterium lividum]|uniref:Repeat domain-containing protein n=1 Tax=Janthinobacterium lividum TaxID=29581 RepID=A0AB38C7B1_9BURK|nr:FG-GAP-like repeat-containing protein [Janthinobacterium lividum]SFX46931.1 Repeat domain-containing protein [Janthinobacterium lividum]